MVSPSQLASWQPARLSEIAEQVLAQRRALTGLHDDLDAGAPPSSWTFTDATRARAEHHRLSGLLATQVSETVGVVEALDTAVSAITAAKLLLEGAMRRAGAQGLNVDHGTGRVTVVRTFDDEDDLAHARSVMHEVSEQIDTALRDADTADQALAAVLTRAATTDVNDVGTLAQQQALLDFQQLGPADQVRYLIDHPEAYPLLGDHVSDAVKAQVGEQIAGDLDRLARHPEDFADAEAVARYGRLLDAFGDDPGVMAPLYERIGPDGLLGTLNGIGSMLYVSSGDEGLTHLAESLRDGLGTASKAEGFDARAYGEDLVRYATVTAGGDRQDAFFRDYPSTAMGASALDFLLRDGDYGEEFVRGVVWELDEFERGNDAIDVEMWMHHSSLGSPLGSIGVEPGRMPDPMAAAIGQLGGHPGLGLEFFGSEDRTQHYVVDRDWSRDGFEGIAKAAFGIGTGPDNLASHPEQTAQFVSTFVDRLPDNPGFTPDKAGAASEHLGSLLKHYMPAVEYAIRTESTSTAGGGIGPLDSDVLPGLDPYPVLRPKDLDSLLAVAVTSEEGMARLAEGAGALRRTMVDNFAQLHPGGYPAALENDVQLGNILNNLARVDGHLQHAVGVSVVGDAVARDAQVAAFTELVSKAAGMVPVPMSGELGELIGSTGTKLWNAGWGQVQELPAQQITEAFGDNAAAARAQQTDEAYNGRTVTVVSNFLALADAGLVDVPAPAGEVDWRPGHGLVSISDIEPGQLDAYRDSAERAMGDLVNLQSVLSAYQSPFTTWSFE
jgi:hypothetical protein